MNGRNVHCGSAGGAPKIQFDQTLYDFGETSQVTTVSGVFKFKNVGDGILKLDYVLPLQVPPASLPSAAQDAPYSTPLQAVGGKAPYIWSLAPGSASLLPGLSLSSNGVISGIPSTAGKSCFIVNVTDALSANASQVMTLTVNASTNPPVVVLTAPSCSASGQFQFTINTTVGLNYTLQYSTNLTDWISVMTFGGSGGPETIIDPNATNKQRYYRVKAGP